MSTVGTTIFEGEGTMSYFTLQNEQYIRRFDYSGSWENTMVMIGLLCNVDTTASFTGGLWIGVQSSADGNVGLKNSASALTVTNGITYGYMGTFIGGVTGMAQYTASISGSGSVIRMISQAYGYRKTGSSTARDGAAHFPYLPTTEDPPRKGIIMAGIATNGLNHFTIPNCGYINRYPEGSKNYTLNTLHECLCQENGTFVVEGVTGADDGFSAQLTNSALTNQSYPMDTINIFWTGSRPLRIYQIAVSTTS